MNPKVTLTFCGGTGSVTGANFLLEVNFSGTSTKILVDCGLEQGTEFAEEVNREEFPYDAASIDFLLVTHAHADHIGLIPKLVRAGFKGTIYSTPATLDLSKVMLPDALRILEDDARKKGVLPLYEKANVDRAFSLWKTVEYHASFTLTSDISVFVKDSGHILGSAMYEIGIAGKKIVFTGDLGNSPALFLRDTDPITDATYLLMESVYGDRNHEPKEERRQKLLDVIRQTIAQKRTLIIPVFSLERTQDILFEINDFVDKKEIGDINVFIDSPLANAVTGVYKKYSADFKASAQELLKSDSDLFDFPHLRATLERRDSERLDRLGNPKIIMAGSGMSNGGRISKHEKRYLPDRDATILLVGYQALGTLGRRIQDGVKTIEIDGENIKVNAKVENIMGYSSHKDSDHLVEFVSETASTVKKVFVVMGEPKAALFLVQRLRDYLGVDAVYPKKGDSIRLF